jgi:hypothetical protein
MMRDRPKLIIPHEVIRIVSESSPEMILVVYLQGDIRSFEARSEN